MGASLPISIWLMKFSTDELLIAPGAMGVIIMIARLWDGVSDPLAGHLSDSTRSRFGRRHVWMLGAALPLAVTLVLLWAPPPMLTGTALVLWMGAAYILWETASTGFLVPYAALGNELTQDYHERTRLFAWRHLIGVTGYGLGLGLVYSIRTSADPRQTAFVAALSGGVAVAIAIVYAWRFLPEPMEHQGRGSVDLWSGIRDVLRNPHARILLVVYAIESFGMGTIAFLTPYILDNVVGDISSLELVLVFWVVPQFVFTPIWLRVSRIVGKKRLWLFGMCLYALGFSANLVIGEGTVWILYAIVIVLGIGGGISTVVAPAIQADVIDYDEYLSGERKEGTYTAVWNLLRKSGWAVAAGIGGVALGAAGYDGELEVQPETVKSTILFLVGAVPAVAYALGALLFTRFSLNEREHQDLVAAISERE